MALPTSYLTTTRNVEAILTAVQAAEAPSKFNRSFLEQLGFKSSGDRLIINVLKAMGFLSSDGVPTERYIRFLDQAEGGKVLAEGLRDAYSDLFALKRDAQTMPMPELKSKIKTLRQGQGTDKVLRNMASTFQAFAKLADWSEPEPKPEDKEEKQDEEETGEDDLGSLPVSLGGLVYTINLQLPESRDPTVYDALFKSLRSHLLG